MQSVTIWWASGPASRNVHEGGSTSMVTKSHVVDVSTSAGNGTTPVTGNVSLLVPASRSRGSPPAFAGASRGIQTCALLSGYGRPSVPEREVLPYFSDTQSCGRRHGPDGLWRRTCGIQTRKRHAHSRTRADRHPAVACAQFSQPFCTSLECTRGLSGRDSRSHRDSSTPDERHRETLNHDPQLILTVDQERPPRRNGRTDLPGRSAPDSQEFRHVVPVSRSVSSTASLDPDSGWRGRGWIDLPCRREFEWKQYHTVATSVCSGP